MKGISETGILQILSQKIDNTSSEEDSIYRLRCVLSDRRNALRLVKMLFYSTMFFIATALAAAPRIAVLPIGANSETKQDAAQDVEKKSQEKLAAIKGVDVDALSKKERRDVRECEGEVSCMHRAVKKNDADYYVIPVVAKYNEDDDEVVLEVSVYDENGVVEDAKRIGPASPKKVANKFVELVAAFATKVEKKGESRKKALSEEGEEVAPRKEAKKSKKSASEEIDEIVSSASREEEEELSPKTAIERGYRAYRDGDLDMARNYFEKAGKRDVTAKKIAAAIKEIAQKKSEAESYLEQKRYEEALRLIEEIEKRDLGIRTLGNKEGFFPNEKRMRLLYEDPSQVDMKKVEAIHQKFVKRIAELRQARAKKIADIEKGLNEKIAAREAKIKEMVDAEKAQEQKEKEYEADLKKRVSEMKYKWEKEDGDLEQQIVALESKVTMMEQKEKGVIKVSTEKRDKEKADELAAVDKKYQDERKRLDAEKESFLNRQKEELGKGGDKVEKEVADLLKRKKEKEEKVVELDKKIQTAMEEFDKADKAKQSDNETVKMKNEDEDRKFLVEVEKEYQKKFDELNQRLSEFDSKESIKKEDLTKFDKEIEEYMSKNAEEMGKIQEEVEKQRSELEKAYQEKKSAAQSDFEAKHKAKIDELSAKKAELEAKIAAWDADTEKMKQEKEAALTAENKPGDIKKEIAKIEKDRKTEKGKIEKDLKKISSDLAAAEKGKENAAANALMAVDAEFEQKFSELDMRLAKESDRLNKLNNDFRKKKLEEKKRYEENFQKFLKDKDAYKRNIEKLIEAAQKERDAKIAKRREERDKLAQSWSKDRDAAKQALDRKLEPDRKLKERLVKEIEEITAKIEQINATWAKDQEALRNKQQEESDKFLAKWKERSEALEKGYAEKKDAVIKKYEKIETDEKNANKEAKANLEREIEKLMQEKNRRKESRQEILKKEKEKWEEQKKRWAEEKERRKSEMEQFKKQSEESLKGERERIIEKKREVEKWYEEELKKINEEETAQMQAQFRDISKEVSKLEIVSSKITMAIERLKADALSRQGLLYLQKEDLIAARRAFVNALYLDKENQTASDGLKAIETTAKSMYWKAYGVRDTNKNEAKRVFEILVKTLMPSSEYFIKAKTALEEIR